MKTEFRPGNSTLLVLFAEYENADVILDGLDVSALVVSGLDWNRDLSPWPAPRVFKKEDDFSGGAAAFLRELLANEVLQRKWDRILIAGYSLAGLFSLWAVTQTDLFAGCASVSGSLWFDGFTDWLKEHPANCQDIYLSVGDREKHSRNPRMAQVESCTETCAGILRKEGKNIRYELNPGTHFDDPEGRIHKGIVFLLGK
jgi:predicted alpha/beta superfamily hydrolase